MAMINYMLALRIDPLGAVISLSICFGLALGVQLGRWTR